MNLNDVIRRSVLNLDSFANYSIINIIVGLSITFLVALVVFYVYKLTFNGVVYNHNYNLAMVTLSLVTALIIMTISSNVILSLGMVGALSIVRFRAAIKDPRDIVFMFWSISVGIACGAGMFVLAIVGTLFISVVLIIMTRTKFVHTSYLLIVKYEKRAFTDLDKILQKLKYTVKSKSVINDRIELTIELKDINKNTAFTDVMANIDGVESAILLKYNGDYTE